MMKFHEYLKRAYSLRIVDGKEKIQRQFEISVKKKKKLWFQCLACNAVLVTFVSPDTLKS